MQHGCFLVGDIDEKGIYFAQLENIGGASHFQVDSSCCVLAT